MFSDVSCASASHALFSVKRFCMGVLPTASYDISVSNPCLQRTMSPAVNECFARLDKQRRTNRSIIDIPGRTSWLHRWAKGGDMSVDYLGCIQVSLDHIEANIHRSLTVPELAALVGFSPYHYYRIFGAYVGLPVMEYVRRRHQGVHSKILPGKQLWGKMVMEIPADGISRFLFGSSKPLLKWTPSPCRFGVSLRKEDPGHRLGLWLPNTRRFHQGLPARVWDVARTLSGACQWPNPCQSRPYWTAHLP